MVSSVELWLSNACEDYLSMSRCDDNKNYQWIAISPLESFLKYPLRIRNTLSSLVNENIAPPWRISLFEWDDNHMTQAYRRKGLETDPSSVTQGQKLARWDMAALLTQAWRQKANSTFLTVIFLTARSSSSLQAALPWRWQIYETQKG